MYKSINLLFGEELKKINYKMLKANNFSKKNKNFFFCIDRDLADHLSLSLKFKDSFGEIKCIDHEFIKNLSTLTKGQFIEKVLEKESIYQTIINEYKN